MTEEELDEFIDSGDLNEGVLLEKILNEFLTVEQKNDCLEWIDENFKFLTHESLKYA